MEHAASQETPVQSQPIAPISGIRGTQWAPSEIAKGESSQEALDNFGVAPTFSSVSGSSTTVPALSPPPPAATDVCVCEPSHAYHPGGCARAGRFLRRSLSTRRQWKRCCCCLGRGRRRGTRCRWCRRWRSNWRRGSSEQQRCGWIRRWPRWPRWNWRWWRRWQARQRRRGWRVWRAGTDCIRCTRSPGA